jgi:hypothetical protein
VSKQTRIEKSRIIHACVQLLTVINNFKTTLYGSQIMKMVFIVENDTSQLTSNKNYHQVVVYGLYWACHSSQIFYYKSRIITFNYPIIE